LLNVSKDRKDGGLLAAIAFYTRLPVPLAGGLEFRRVACFAPLVGLLIGSLLVLVDQGLTWLNVPALTRSAVVVVSWVALTGGLHLDGVIDSADGLAVPDSSRRLVVMAESTVGAFGVMAAVVLILLKTAALVDLSSWRGLVLPVVAGWGRWGQQVAIACYPYLKPTGKGAFHKTAIRSFWDCMPSLLLLLGLSFAPCGLAVPVWSVAVGLALGSAIASGVAAWFAWQLGGHTGDTYGAVVEWTEALLLVLLTVVQSAVYSIPT
jgi:adenosylcobinamide-GDP ribazoletransferase